MISEAWTIFFCYQISIHSQDQPAQLFFCQLDIRSMLGEGTDERQRKETGASEKEASAMTLIQKSVTINTPVDDVLAILEDPERQSELEGEPLAALSPPFSAGVL
jgi:hypothetical protein